MEALLETLNTKFLEAADILNFNGDMSNLDAADAENLAELLAETITLIEKNQKELQSCNIGAKLLDDLDRLKYCAVVVYKSIPYLSKTDDLLTMIDNDLIEIVDSYLDELDKTSVADDEICSTCYNDPCICYKRSENV